MSDELKPKDKLNALGLKAPDSQENPLQSEFESLLNGIDTNLSGGWLDFQNDVSNQSSFGEFETYLTDTLGLSSSDASTLRQKYQSKFGTFSDFQNAVSSYSSFEEFENSFTWGDTISGETTEDGQNNNAGIRFHSEAGITKEGVSVPAGTVEIFGPEVHFSQTGATADEDPDKSSLFSYSNMDVSDSSVLLGDTPTVSVDLTNNGSYQENFLPVLLVDGEVQQEGDLIKIGAGNTRELSFEFKTPDTGDFEVQINKSPTRTITVNYAGL
jgi:hypothetical protein